MPDQGFVPFVERLADVEGVKGVRTRPDDVNAEQPMAIVGAESDSARVAVESAAVERGLDPGEPFEADDMVGVPVRDPERQQSDTTFFGMSGGRGSDIRPVDIERQQPSGKFAPPNTRSDPTVPPDRGPNGKFVSPDRGPLDDIGRRDDDGLFDLF
jgi:hypothetical protein